MSACSPGSGSPRDRDVPSDEEVSRAGFLSGKRPGRPVAVAPKPVRALGLRIVRARSSAPPETCAAADRSHGRSTTAAACCGGTIVSGPPKGRSCESDDRSRGAFSADRRKFDELASTCRSTLNGVRRWRRRLSAAGWGVDSWIRGSAAVTTHAGDDLRRRVELEYRRSHRADAVIVAEELAPAALDQVAYVQGDTDRTPGSQGHTAGKQDRSRIEVARRWRIRPRRRAFRGAACSRWPPRTVLAWPPRS